jgi:hypothetical protein
VALQPEIAATDRTTRTPSGEDTVATVGAAGGPLASPTHAPEADRPGSASTRSGGWARSLAKIANGPSNPAKCHRGGMRASCSWPSATTTLASAATTEGGPSTAGAARAWATTATLATGRGTVMVRVEGVVASARNQRVEPPAVLSPT